MIKHKNILIYLAVIATLVARCSRTDKDVLFNSEEIKLINSLIITGNPPSDTTNAYEDNANAATLGQKFYFDPQFSGNITVVGKVLDPTDTTYATLIDVGPGTGNTSQKINCATCHNPSLGFEDRTSSADQQDNSTSFAAKSWTGRKALTVFNAYYNSQLWLWAGQADSAWGMMSRPVEGGPHNFGRVSVVRLICTSYTTDYNAVGFTSEGTLAAGSGICSTVEAQFTATNCGYTTTPGKFGDTCYNQFSSTDQTSINRIFSNYAKAIAAYEKKLVSKNSAFDKWAQGDESAMSSAAKRGLKVFLGKGNCVSCHNGPAFTDNQLHNIGVPQDSGFVNTTDSAGFGSYTHYSGDTTGQHSMFRSDGPYSDDTTTGATRVLAALTATLKTTAKGAFKTPGLRNVSQRGPFMHTGKYKNLWEVVNHYSFGGVNSGISGSIDEKFDPRNLTNSEMLDLVEFLNALEGESLASSLLIKNF